MKLTRKAGLAGIAAGAAVLLGVTALAATAAQAASTPPQFYLLDGGDGHLIPDGTVLAWSDQVLSSPGVEVSDLDTPFPGSPDATGSTIFIAPVGQETTVSAWLATGFAGFKPGTQDLVSPNLTLSGFTNGNWATVKAGGTYSLGFAWTKNNGLNLATAGVKFVQITVASGGAGNWTFANQAPAAADPCEVDPAACQSKDIALSAETLAAQDAGLTLAVAANAATIGSPTLVDGVSVSTGTLPAITVHDARVVSHPGWTLTSTVADFVQGSDTIDKKQLGIKPTKTSGPAGVAAGAEQTAGSATYPSTFAEADNAATIGDTVLGGALTFVAPVGKPAGTYTSTLTLTLISK